MLDWRPWPQFSSTRLPMAIATTTKKLIYLNPLVTRILCKQHAGSTTVPVCRGTQHDNEDFMQARTSSSSDGV